MKAGTPSLVYGDNCTLVCKNYISKFRKLRQQTLNITTKQPLYDTAMD
jgi:hypothetical protein